MSNFHGWARIGPGEGGLLDLVVSADHGDDAVATALVSSGLDRARTARLDRVIAHSPAGPTARVYRDLGFRRLPWRDRPDRTGTTLLAFGLELAPVEVRQAEPTDLASAGALTLASYAADGLVDPNGGYARRLLDAAGRASAATLLVAVTPAGQVVGTVTFCRPGSPWAELSTPGEAEFRMLAVDPAARGSGIGAALVHACLDLAGAAGDHTVVLSTSASMRAAAGLYRRLGFQADPTRNWSPEPGIDLLAYQRPLLPDPTPDPAART